MTFESPNALSGIIRGSFINNAEFKGIKQESENGQSRIQDVDWSAPVNAWRSRNKTAYERAENERWEKGTRYCLKSFEGSVNQNILFSDLRVCNVMVTKTF